MTALSNVGSDIQPVNDQSLMTASTEPTQALYNAAYTNAPGTAQETTANLTAALNLLPSTQLGEMALVLPQPADLNAVINALPGSDQQKIITAVSQLPTADVQTALAELPPADQQMPQNLGLLISALPPADTQSLSPAFASLPATDLRSAFAAIPAQDQQTLWAEIQPALNLVANAATQGVPGSQPGTATGDNPAAPASGVPQPGAPAHPHESSPAQSKPQSGGGFPDDWLGGALTTLTAVGGVAGTRYFWRRNASNADTVLARARRLPPIPRTRPEAAGAETLVVKSSQLSSGKPIEIGPSVKTVKYPPELATRDGVALKLQNGDILTRYGALGKIENPAAQMEGYVDRQGRISRVDLGNGQYEYTVGKTKIREDGSVTPAGETASTLSYAQAEREFKLAKGTFERAQDFDKTFKPSIDKENDIVTIEPGKVTALTRGHLTVVNKVRDDGTNVSIIRNRASGQEAAMVGDGADAQYYVDGQPYKPGDPNYAQGKAEFAQRKQAFNDRAKDYEPGGALANGRQNSPIEETVADLEHLGE